MLQFIFGRAASGKSTLLLDRLKKAVEAGKETIVIVPEQFSFETEKTMLKLLSAKQAAQVSVMSFSRLCDEVERNVGGMCGKRLTDAGKLILLSRALNDCAADLKFWKKYVKNQGFISAMLDSIEEFKLNSILPQDLNMAAESTESVSLKAKLHDTALIFETYNGLIGERYLDPSDKLSLLYDRLAKFDIFKGKTVFLDTFKSFTGQQYKILNRIFASADDVYIALTNDNRNMKRYDVFENIRKTADRIKRIAASHGVKLLPDIMLETEYYKNKSLAAAEEILSRGYTDISADDGAVCVCRAATVYDEAEFAARTIRRLVRSKGYRYRDFVIITRDTVPYEEAVSAACERNNVSCFIDKRLPLTDFPTVGTVLAAFEAVRGFSTEQILRFHKSGLNLLNTQDLSLLENYARLWNIKGKKWLVEWDMNPDGLISGQADNADERLQQINSLRCRAINPIAKFKKEFEGSAKDRAKAVVELLSMCKAQESFLSLAHQFAEDGMLSRSDALRQSWDMMMDIFDSLVDCYGNSNLDDDEFCNSFKIAAALATIGVAPQMLDEVSFGAADRIRTSRPKIAFILGANQGSFPAVTSSSGLFGLTDREKLIDLGIEIPDRSISSAIDEDFLVYTNLCCATEKLYISYCVLDASQSEREPSNFVSRINSQIPCLNVSEPAETGGNITETAAATFSNGCSIMSHSRENAESLFNVIDDDYYKLRSDRVFEAINPTEQRITSETAKKLLGENLYISASKLDTFQRCKFQFFCRYALGAKKMQPADFDVLQRGTLIHYILERIIEEYSSEIAELTDEQVYCAVDRYISEYIEAIPGYKSVDNPHLNFLLQNIARSVKEVCLQLRAEFAQSDFKPKYCEFKFGTDGKPPVTVDFEEGKILLNGSVDRVDTWNGYLRIVDYKSGSRSFRLPDILVGQNLQMLLYLYALTRDGEFSKSLPAGIFYMPSKRDRNEKGLAMNGLMVGDEDLVRAMDKNNKGEFVPQYKLTAKGELHKSYAASFIGENDFEYIFEYIEELLKKTGKSMLSGEIAVDPVDGIDSAACKYCDFAAVCGIGDTLCPKAEKFTNEEVIDKITKEVHEDGI